MCVETTDDGIAPLSCLSYLDCHTTRVWGAGCGRGGKSTCQLMTLTSFRPRGSLLTKRAVWIRHSSAYTCTHKDTRLICDLVSKEQGWLENERQVTQRLALHRSILKTLYGWLFKNMSCDKLLSTNISGVSICMTVCVCVCSFACASVCAYVRLLTRSPMHAHFTADTLARKSRVRCWWRSKR